MLPVSEKLLIYLDSLEPFMPAVYARIRRRRIITIMYCGGLKRLSKLFSKNAYISLHWLHLAVTASLDE